MQKILAILLLIGLINGTRVTEKLGKLNAGKNDRLPSRIETTGTKEKTQRLFEVNDEKVQEKAFVEYQKCVAEGKNQTECFLKSMEKIATNGNGEELKNLANLKDGIVACKQGDAKNLSKCILELGESQELQTIAEVVEIPHKVNELFEKMEAEAKEFEKENFECSDNEGHKVCKPTAKFEQELIDEQEKAEAEYKLRFKTEEITVTINGEEQTIPVDFPTEKYYDEAIEANQKFLEEYKEKLTEDDIESINAEIKSLKEMKVEKVDLEKITADYQENINKEEKFLNSSEYKEAIAEAEKYFKEFTEGAIKDE